MTSRGATTQGGRGNARSPIVRGTKATFHYHDSSASTVELMSDSTGWQPVPLVRHGGSWSMAREYPSDARDEYLLLVDGHAILDPLNLQRSPSVFGARSACQMPGYRPPRKFDLPVDGKMERRRLAGRTVDVYVPVESRHAALLVVQDGYDYEWFIGMPGLLDSLIRERAMVPTIAIFVAPQNRDHEYIGNDDYVTWMADRLMQAVRRRYAIDPDPARHGLVGASGGGLAATYAAARRPDSFRLVGAQSPDFRRIRGADLSARLGQMRNVDWSSLRVHVDGGTFEALLGGQDFLASIRQGVAELRQRGCVVQYNEVHEGHNWTNWRARLPDLLSWLLGRTER
ncbi:MAG TPA: alpha/beta hydrolase-fold protein [Chloroflexota bacterium]